MGRALTYAGVPSDVLLHPGRSRCMPWVHGSHGRSQKYGFKTGRGGAPKASFEASGDKHRHFESLQSGK